MTSLADFYDRLQAHDWTYNYADDGKAWDRGHKEQTALAAIALQSEAHQALFDAMEAHYLKQTGPLPARPQAEGEAPQETSE